MAKFLGKQNTEVPHTTCHNRPKLVRMRKKLNHSRRRRRPPVRESFFVPRSRSALSLSLSLSLSLLPEHAQVFWSFFAQFERVALTLSLSLLSRFLSCNTRFVYGSRRCRETEDLVAPVSEVPCCRCVSREISKGKGRE
jgi:hypothetical protein